MTVNESIPSRGVGGTDSTGVSGVDGLVVTDEIGRVGDGEMRIVVGVTVGESDVIDV